MTTLQEYLNERYPTKEDKEKVKEIDIREINRERKKQGITENLGGGDLDLSEFKNLEKFTIIKPKLLIPLTKLNVNNLNKLEYLDCFENGLIDLNVRGLTNLKKLILNDNNLTSVEFLNQLPNPEKLEWLIIFNNNIQPTEISFFSKFTNLKTLKIGTTNNILEKGKRNQFYGSLKSYQNLIKLEDICIEATDINEGLEYLPFSLIQNIKTYKGKLQSYCLIECSPHGLNVGCANVQNQLKKYDYDIEAWQLAHPAEMFRERPELFASGESKEKWLNALNNKIEKTQTKLQEIKQNNFDKVKKIKRLNTKLGELNTIKQLLEERTIFEDSLKTQDQWYKRLEVKKEDKTTQTEQLLEQIEGYGWAKTELLNKAKK